MRASEQPFDAELTQWCCLEEELTSSGLLLGNGASRAIWDNFQYDSLYNKAKKLPTHQALTDEDVAIFSAHNTNNFERVLQALNTTEKTLNALDTPDVNIMDRYYHIRKALVHAVHGIHIPRNMIPDDTLKIISDELRRYRFVYSTNYDMIVYWAIMHEKVEGFSVNFVDYFWNTKNSFNLDNTEVRNNSTRLLFVHGALHIYSNGNGDTCKLVKGKYSILDQFKRETTIPVFVSEGTYQDKLEAIYNSDYLSFAYSTLMQHKGPMVIFGQGLGDSDQHIVNAVNIAGPEQIAIGIYHQSDQQIIESKAHYKKCFAKRTLTFFDSRSHPLGDINLRVTP